MHTSCWQDIERPQYESLKEEIHADVAVIGGGLCGILCAHRLQSLGVDVVVLEAEHIGAGTTGHTTAKITTQHRLIYDRLRTSFGSYQAKLYAQANQQALEEYTRLVEENHIDCDFKRENAYVYASKEKDVSLLEREAEAAYKVGLPASIVYQTSLPFEVQAALEFPDQAQFHPLKFLYWAAKDLRIYEHSRVLSVEDNVVKTADGSVKAGKIIVCTHYPFLNTPGYYFLRMYQQRSYVLALRGTDPIKGMYIDADEKGYSFRQYGDLLLLGGQGHKCGRDKQGERYKALNTYAQSIYPDAQAVYSWSAQDCITLDGLPYVGHYSPKTPDLFVATGFAKWGMTNSMAAAIVLGDLVRDKLNPLAEVFSPRRLELGASSVSTWLTSAKDTLQGLTVDKMASPQLHAREPRPGEGATVEDHGHKMGAFKDGEGQVHKVKPTCSHLGCALTWNADEQSWDCPCHGSRFTADGAVIDGPAQHKLDGPTGAIG